MSDPLKSGPTQIDGVTGIDRMDTLDRQGLDPRIKLELLCQETRTTLGRDPRGGGFAFVARPRVMLQIMLDLERKKDVDAVRLQRPVVAGSEGGDIVGWYKDIPLLVRSNVRDDNMYCVRVDQIPDSQMIDRRRAAEIRMNAHGGTLSRLLEN